MSRAEFTIDEIALDLFQCQPSEVYNGSSFLYLFVWLLDVNTSFVSKAYDTIIGHAY